jgi:hypothetical protein
LNTSESNSCSRSLIQTDLASWVSRSKSQPNLSNPDSGTLSSNGTYPFHA